MQSLHLLLCLVTSGLLHIQTTSAQCHKNTGCPGKFSIKYDVKFSNKGHYLTGITGPFFPPTDTTTVHKVLEYGNTALKFEKQANSGFKSQHIVSVQKYRLGNAKARCVCIDLVGREGTFSSIRATLFLNNELQYTSPKAVLTDCVGAWCEYCINFDKWQKFSFIRLTVVKATKGISFMKEFWVRACVDKVLSLPPGGSKFAKSQTKRPGVAKARTKRPRARKVRTKRPRVAKVRTPTPRAAKVRTPTPRAAKVRTPTPGVAVIRTPRPAVAVIRTPSPQVVGIQPR